MKNWERQMKAAKEKMKAGENKKKELEEKIENFILEVYSIKLMDDCADFLKAVKESSLVLSDKAKKTLFGRLFLLEHTYRKSFDKFQQILSETKDKYEYTKFDVNPDSLRYFAERSITEGKFKSSFTLLCNSKDSSSAELSYTGKKEFHIAKAKAEAAEEIATESSMKYKMYAGSEIMKTEILNGHKKVTYELNPDLGMLNVATPESE